MRNFISAVTTCLLLAGPSLAADLPCPNLGITMLKPSTGSIHHLRTHLADDPETMSRGLMWVTDLDADEGMLFDFGSEQQVGFWMKNTLIPLDMIFMDGQGLVTGIHRNAMPGDLTTIRSPGNARFVLELNAGTSDTLRLSIGDKMTLATKDEQCQESREIHDANR